MPAAIRHALWLGLVLPLALFGPWWAPPTPLPAIPVPRPVTPASGLGLDQPAPEFRWTSRPAPFYQIEVADEPTFARPLIAAQTSEPRFDSAGLRPLTGGAYYWRVRADDDGGRAGAWSPVQSFQGLAAPRGALPLDPVADRAVGQRPVFAWATVETGANDRPTHYVFQLAAADDAEFVDPLVARELAASYLTLNQPLAGGRGYRWRVGSVNAAGLSWSPAQSFRVLRTRQQYEGACEPLRNTLRQLSVDASLALGDVNRLMGRFRWTAATISLDAAVGRQAATLASLDQLVTDPDLAEPLKRVRAVWEGALAAEHTLLGALRAHDPTAYNAATVAIRRVGPELTAAVQDLAAVDRRYADPLRDSDLAALSEQQFLAQAQALSQQVPRVWPSQWGQVEPLPLPLETLPEKRLTIPILMYHHVGTLPAKADDVRKGLTVAPAVFAEQLRALSQAGYVSVSFADLVAALRGQRTLPPKAVLITLDDGYADTYDYALPALRAVGYSATWFIAPGLLGTPDYLTWAQVEALSRAGMSIEAHTVSHPDLTRLPRARVEQELVESRDAIEAHTGRSVVAFAYPYGNYNRGIVDVLRDNGVELAATTQPGVIQSSRSPYELARIKVFTTDGGSALVKKLQPGR